MAPALVLALAAACGAGGDQALGDWPHHETLDDLEQASDHALLVRVTDVRRDVVDDIDSDVVQADVLASDPALGDTVITLDTVHDTGLHDSVEMLPGSTYAVFVTITEDGGTTLVSPYQGVFPVTGGVAGPSDAGTFPLGAVAGRLGLTG